MTALHQLNRHQRRSVLAGSIALLAVLGAGTATVNQAFADTPDGPSAKAGAAADTLSGETAPVTPRSLTAALQAAVADVADGKASGFEGFLSYASSWQTHDPLDDSPERDTHDGWFTFTPADGSAGALVRASVQDKAGMDYNQTAAEENFASCTDMEEDCEVSTLPDGSLLKTYVEHIVASNGDDEGYEIFTARRMVGDAVVTVSATNGGEATEAGNEVTRPHAVLSAAQLTDIVSQPWWGYDLPQEFAEAGAALPSYHETDSIID